MFISNEFKDYIEKIDFEDTPISPGKPWQNPICERANGTLRRGCLDHVIIFNETHLHNILDEYINELDFIYRMLASYAKSIQKLLYKILKS